VTEFGLVAPLGGLVLMMFLYLRRLAHGAAATAWGAAWLALYLAGTLSGLPDAKPLVVGLSHVCGSLFPALLLAGALAFRSGRIPAWPVPAGIGLGLLRWALLASGRPDLGLVIAAPGELPFTLGAAAVMWRAARDRPRSFPEQILGPALVLLAFINAADPIARLLGLPMAPLLVCWITASLAVALLQVAAFVERGRERERRLLEERDLLYRVARIAAADPRDAGVALDDVVAAIAAATAHDARGVWLLTESGTELECVARLRRIDELPPDLERLPADDRFLRRAFESPEPVTVMDLGGAEGQRGERARELGLGEAALAPLRAGDRTLGVVVAALNRGRHFDTADLRLAAGLAQEIALVVAHGRAVSERARQATALGEERRMLRALVEAVPTGIVLVDREGRITTLSARAADQLGIGDPEAWLGRTAADVFEFYAPRLAPGEVARARRRFARGPTAVDDFPVCFATPSEQVLAFSMREVRSNEGERLGALWLIRDASNDRRLAERMSRARHLETLGMLAEGLGHHLDGQLTVLLGSVRRLRAHPGPGGGGPAGLEQLETTAERCAEGVRGLLAFARRAPPVPRSVAVEEALREVQARLGPTLPGDVRLEVSVEPGTPPLRADADGLHRVLANLALNARDAVGPAGTIVLAARDGGERAARHGGAPAGEARWVEIEVRDDGAGIEADTLERVFDPFFSTKPADKGTGLGLAIAAAIVEAHRGSIAVESTPGEGTVCRLTWPAAADPALDGPGEGA
jgi:PAS domain S-box-containing protein